MKMSGMVFIATITIAMNCSAQNNFQPIPPPPGKYEVFTSQGIPNSLYYLIRASNLIIDGTVEKVFSPVRIDPGGPTSLVTHAQISVNKVIRGELPKDQQSVIIAEQGGSSEGYDVVYDRNPLVQSGERYILFLNPYREREGLVVPHPNLGISIYSIVGGWEGKGKVTEKGAVQFLRGEEDIFTTASDRSDVEAYLAKVKKLMDIIDGKFPRARHVSSPETLPSFLIP
jgi:hypothetical protein